MKDFEGTVNYKGRELKLVFNLNVMEEIQNEYGTLEEWGRLTDGVAYAKREYEKLKNGIPWDDLSDEEKTKYTGEPDAKAVIFGFTQMINEGIDIANEDNGTDEKPMTLKQVGRLITDIGMDIATKQLNKTVVESTKGDEKNA